MSAMIQGDISVTGEQAICGTCHRRSGMGSLEGQQVVPAVTGKMLFNPLRLPTSQTESAPVLRNAYTRESLKLAIRSGIDANGKLLDPIMPRYPLDDESLDMLIDYLSGLSQEFSPGVDDKDIHFATVVSEGVGALEKKALLDVIQTFIEQKNTETRHESYRAEHAPWHKEWMFKPYRKWVLHVWELKGPQETWNEQLKAYYEHVPVFALLSGRVTGPWAPIHHFCEASHLPCLFPTTDLPVINESDFYSFYTDGGMDLEGRGVASTILKEVKTPDRVIQVYRLGDIKAETAAKALADSLRDSGMEIVNRVLPSPEVGGTSSHTGINDQSVLVVWGGQSELMAALDNAESKVQPQRIYLSTTLFTEMKAGVPESLKDRVYFIHTQELPKKLDRLLARSTGWFKMKRIYAPEAKAVQANAYFALKAAGGALKLTRGYFYRDYFAEKIENMTDNANYTSIYPRVSLAPDQRFASRGYYITKLQDNKLEAVSEWTIP